LNSPPYFGRFVRTSVPASNSGEFVSCCAFYLLGICYDLVPRSPHTTRLNKFPDWEIWGGISVEDRVPKSLLENLGGQDQIRIRVFASREMDDDSPCVAIARRIGSEKETVEKACVFLQAIGWIAAMGLWAAPAKCLRGRSCDSQIRQQRIHHSSSCGVGELAANIANVSGSLYFDQLFFFRVTSDLVESASARTSLGIAAL